jgi:hypothetical protein
MSCRQISRSQGKSLALYNNKWFRRVGIVVTALLLVSVWAVNLLALVNHVPWVGVNYWNQPIDTWGQLIVLICVTAFGAYWLVRNHRWWL